MKSLRLESPGNLVTAEAPHPGPPGHGEALVRVHRVGVCGTDIHAYHGRQPFFTYPRVLGHELGVEVLAVGEGVDTLTPGDRCSVEPYLNCGQCIACRRGKPNCCKSIKVLGVHIDGGQCEEILVPVSKLHPSKKLNFDQLALVETLAIGAHATERARLRAGETVAVLGAGPIGLSAIQFASAVGASVVVVDICTSRLDFCRTHLGIPDSHVINSREVNVLARLQDITNGDLPTAVFDATGNAASMTASFELPAHGGRLVFIGLFPGEVTFNDPDFHRRELDLLASRNALPADFSRIIEAVESGKIDTTPWITHRAGLDEVPAVFGSWAAPDSGVLKAMIEI